MNELKDRLKEARKRAGRTQVQVAEAVGMKQPSYHQLESGRANASTFLPLIAQYLGVDPVWLLNGEDGGTLITSTESPASSSNPKLVRLIRSLEQLEKDGTPAGFLESLQKLVDVVSQQSKKSAAPPPTLPDPDEVARLNKELFGD